MSSPSPIVNFGIRGFQIIFAAIVLGLSVGLLRGQKPDLDTPISLRYAAFVGGVSLVAGFVGIVAEWVSILQGKVGLLIDGVITLLNAAGGVLLAVLIGVPKCGDTSYENREKLNKNHLFNGGCYNEEALGGNYVCWNKWDERIGQLNARCKEVQADTVFMFFIVVILLGSSTLTFLRAKKGY